MKKVLWISLVPPYGRVKHAGGQNIFQMFNFINKNTDDMEIKNISLCKNEEYNDIIESTNSNDLVLAVEKNTCFNRVIDFESRFNMWNRFGGYLSNTRYFAIRKKILEVYNTGYKPDIIVLHWTEMIMLLNFVQSLYSNARIVTIEEDVSFLKRERRYKKNQNILKKLLHYIRYKNSKKVEISMLRKSDLVVVNNKKDELLLLKNGILPEKLIDFQPYFHQYFNTVYNSKKKNIVFWGAMNRSENSESVKWFIDNVLSLDGMQIFQFVVVGANPPSWLRNLNHPNLTVTGFVESPSAYFSDCLCVVIPLTIGAGIKIKTLEAMSAGIPVISNYIGIEGIPAVNGVNYLLANTPIDFKEKIFWLYNLSDGELHEFGFKAREFIKNEFNFENKLSVLLGRIRNV